MPKKKEQVHTIKVPSWIYEEIVVVGGWLQARRREQVAMSYCIETAWKLATGLSVPKSDAQQFLEAIEYARSQAAKQTKAG